jgi:hypothetical protein
MADKGDSVTRTKRKAWKKMKCKPSRENLFFINNLFTKSTDKIHCRYEAPREEPREAHGYLALGCDGYMVALSVDVDR